MKIVRNAVLALTLILSGVHAMTEPALAQAQNVAPVTTGVLVILTAKANVTRDQIMAVLPNEVRQTVQLYVGGKIREWFSRADGRGAIFLLDTRDIAEAHAIMDGLPLGQQNLMDHEYIAVGPLFPLRLLLATPERAQ
jgi:hypothetical protein